MNNQANTAEDFLRSNNLALCSVFDKGQIGLTTIDPDFRFLEMNEAFCRMMGYSKQELNRLTIQDITHPHYIEKDIESMNKLMKGEIKVYKTEKRYIRKDHSTSCGAVTMTAIHNKNGEFLYFLALIEDISERKHAEIALSESEKRLRLLLKNSMDAIFLATPDGNIIEVNTVACELFGYAEEEFKQITRYDILDQSDPRLAAAIDERSQKGKFRGEFTGIKKDGTKFPIEMSTSLFNDHHENPLVSVIIRDFTKSKQVEQALKASEESYRNLFDDNPLMIFTLDTQGIVRDVNKAAAQQLGYKINELIGKPIFHIYHKDSREAVSLQFNGLLQNPEQTYKWEQRKVNKKGNIIWVKETAKVLFPANCDTTVVIMCEDITSLKEAEEGQIETQRLLSISQRLAHIGSWETELSTGKLSWSDEMYRILGFPAVSPISLDMALSVFQPEELARFNKAISSALKGDVPYNIDYTIIRHDGQVRIIHDEGEVVFDEHGTALRMFGATQDITERKNAENLLQKSEARLNLALQSASMGVWHLDIIEGRRYFDDQVCYLLGINPATFTGAEDEFYEVVHPEDSPTIKAELARTIETDVLYEPEYRAVWPDKSVHYITARGRLYRDDKGAPVRINGIIWDITERKRAAEALQKSEEKYRTIFENVQDVFYQADISGIFREISPSISNFSEFNRDDIIGTSATDLYYNPDDRQTLLNAIMKNGEIRDYEVKFKTKTGEIRHVSINARLIADAKGRSNHIDGAIRDVTQRKLAEEALRLSEERYRFSLEITGQIGWSTPPDGLVEDMPLWRQYSGQNIEELKRWKWLDSIHPDDREHANKAWANAVAQKCKYETEYRIRRADGVYRYFMGRGIPLFNTDGTVREWAGTCIDITERKQVEEALKESEERFKALFEHSPDAIFLTDIETGLIIDANHQASELLAKTLKEIIGMHQSKLHLPRFEAFSKVAFQERVEKSKQSGKNHYVELFVLRSDGTEVPVEILSNVITVNGKPVMQRVFRDITGRKQAEEVLKNYSLDLEETVKQRTAELESAKERAESADRLKSAFLATMSHELRTPLNSVIGFSGILLQEKAGTLNEEQKKQIGLIQLSGRHLLSLINDILDLSKIEVGQLLTNYESFNIQDVIQEVIKLQWNSARNKGLSLRFAKIPGIGEIVSDKRRVHQVLLNILNNAFKFTEKGYVRIDCHQDKDFIKVEISDTGIGIKEEDLNKLFNPFIQVDNELTRTHQGSGLGLSISKKLMELLHGTIEVKSEFGVGSTFTLTFPLLEVEND